MLALVYQRVARAASVDRVLLATSSDPSDDPVEELCLEQGFACFRGPLDDVLARYYQGALAHGATQVVRITADCPLIDPELIDQVVATHLESGADYTSNVAPRTVPDGLDTEVLTFETLRRLHRTVVDPVEREHVTLHIDRHPGRFQCANATIDTDLSAHRWTVDTREDFEWVDRVLRGLDTTDFSYREVLDFITENDCARYQEDGGEARADDLLHGTGQELYRRAKSLIPGGTQLLSKRPEMFLPDRWPAYYAAARGPWLKDLDGRSLLDMSSNGIGACTLGAADPVVNAAVQEAVRRGSMSSLNAPEEVALAELLCELHPWAEKVRFARTGGESMSIAVRIARAATGKDTVLFCGYHGWSDWYLATNLGNTSGLDELLLPGLEPKGVPRELAGTALPFHFNNTEELEQLLAAHSGRIAAIVMEPQRSHQPEAEFLRTVRAAATREGAPLILDEITAGFRKNIGGLHLHLGLTPDIAVFGKALGNGFAIGAIAGTAAVMEHAQDTFISSTFWTERLGPVAALATIARMRELDSPALLQEAGRRVQELWREAAASHSVPIHAGPADMTPLSHFSFQWDEDRTNTTAHTAWTALMLSQGVLDAASFYATTTHTAEVCEYYAEKLAQGFAGLAAAVHNGTLSGLAGELAHSGFQRLT